MDYRFRVADYIVGGALKKLRDEVRYAESGLSVVRDTVGQLQAEQQAGGWVVNGEKRLSFSRQSIKDIADCAFNLYFENPVIHRGVNIQADYVFAQGFTLSSPNATVQQVLSDWQTDLRNQAVVTEPEAAARRDIELQCGGNLFVAAFTDELHGHVSNRVFEAHSIEDVIRNPDDAEEPWFYRRSYVTEKLDYTSGVLREVTKTVYHPDVNYHPLIEEETIGGHEIMWDAPLFHFKPNALSGMKFGVCEFYSAHSPAKSYRRFLGHRMTVAEALSQFCLKFIHKGAGAAKAAGDVASALANRLRQGRNRAGDKAGDEAGIGEAAVFGDGGDVEAVNVKGATINPDDGRRVALMAFAGFGFPETFWGDASVGTLATAQSLDRPTEFKIERRRRFWADALASLALYAVMQAARASDNPFNATVSYRGSTPVVTLPDGNPVVIEVSFPDILEHDITKTVGAISTAAAHIPDPATIAELLLNALKVKGAPELLKKLKFPDPAKAPPEKEGDDSK